MENISEKVIDSHKGFARLVFDVSLKKPIVKLVLNNGHMVQGKMISNENNMVVLLQFQDRFNYDYVYIPTERVTAISFSHEEHAKLV
jgi:hypothetical protein